MYVCIIAVRPLNPQLNLQAAHVPVPRVNVAGDMRPAASAEEEASLREQFLALHPTLRPRVEEDPTFRCYVMNVKEVCVCVFVCFNFTLLEAFLCSL